MIYMENCVKQRYYLLFTEQDLFGTWCLIKSFGSLMNNRGRTIIQVCQDKKAALEALFDVESKKRQRGYKYADLPHSDQFHLRPQTIQEVIALRKTQTKLPDTAINEISHSQVNPNQQDLFDNNDE